MKKIFFWHEWKKQYQILYLILLGILLLAFFSYLFSFLFGMNYLMDWDITSQFDTIGVSIDKFTDHLFNYSVDTTSYITKQNFFGTTIKIIPSLGAIYMTLLAIGTCVALAVITRLEFTSYAIGMGLFIFMIVFLNTDVLGIWGGSKKFAIAMILTYGAISYYFQAYDQKLSFIQRLLIFLFVTAIFAVIISSFSNVQHPFFYLANFGIIVPIILSIIFIISISFDIVIGFLFITSGKNTSRNSIYHFIFISVLYFCDLLLILLKKKGILKSDIILISAFIIYVISAILGIWCVKKRSVLFKNIINVSLASFLYISFAIISTATMAYAFATGNDPMVSMFEYAILYSHLGIGVIFFLYILYNFWELFEKKVPAFEIMFNPTRMPFFMVRPLGIVIMLSLLFQSNLIPFKAARAGYYNLEADVYYSEGRLTEAKELYNEGSIFSKGNIKSNYSLANVLVKLNNVKEAQACYEATLERKPTEYAYANLGSLYLKDDQFFYAWFKLKEGLKKYPESPYLHNNMAMIYGSKGLWDSTFYHLNKANEFKANNEDISTNLMWLFLKINLLKEADSLENVKNYTDNISFQINKTSSDIIQKKPIRKKDYEEKFLKDSILNIRSFAYLYNAVLDNAKSSDTALVSKISNFAKYQSNEQFYFELMFLKSIKLYYSGYRKEAINLLNNLGTTASQSSQFTYNKILGLWSLEMSSYEQAAKYLESTNLLDAEAQLYKAIALLESGYTADGMEQIKNLTKTPNNQVREAAENLLKVYSFKNEQEVLTSNEAIRYKFIHFKKNDLKEGDLFIILNSFTTPDYKLIASTEIIDYYLDRNEIAKARDIYNSAMTVAKATKQIEYGEKLLNFKNLEILEKENQWSPLLNAAKANPSIPENKNIYLPYYLAVANMNLGNKKEADTYFREALHKLPLTEYVYLKASEFYQKENKDNEAYDILVQGINVNPSSTTLLKAYALMALKLNMTNYADDTMSKLKDMLSPAEYSKFRVQYEQEKAAAEKQFEQF